MKSQEQGLSSLREAPKGGLQKPIVQKLALISSRVKIAAQFDDERESLNHKGRAKDHEGL
jgi:hypothetical protein